jgi:hypothetical protein
LSKEKSIFSLRYATFCPKILFFVIDSLHEVRVSFWKHESSGAASSGVRLFALDLVCWSSSCLGAVSAVQDQETQEVLDIGLTIIGEVPKARSVGATNVGEEEKKVLGGDGSILIEISDAWTRFEFTTSIVCCGRWVIVAGRGVGATGIVEHTSAQAFETQGCLIGGSI